jgi:hypothetical protein
MAVKKKTSKTHYPYSSGCGSRGKPRISSRDMKEKLDPYMQPLYDALRDMLPNEKLEDYILGIIQIAACLHARTNSIMLL